MTGKPIKFIGVGEKLDQIEPFHPGRMASRILGMGDMLTLIEKAEAAFDQKKAEELEKKLRTNKFTLADFYDQLVQIKGMGSLEDIAGMMPGMNMGALKGAAVDEKALSRTEAIIQSMTPYERENPAVLNHSRKRRIAAGSGVKVEDINRLLKQFDMMNQMIKQFSGPGASKKMKRMSKHVNTSFQRIALRNILIELFFGGNIKWSRSDSEEWALRRTPTTASLSPTRTSRATAASSRRSAPTIRRTTLL